MSYPNYPQYEYQNSPWPPSPQSQQSSSGYQASTISTTSTISYLPPPGPPPSQSWSQPQNNQIPGGYGPTGYNMPSPPGFAPPLGPPRTSSPYGISVPSPSIGYQPQALSTPFRHFYHPNYIPLPQGRYDQSLIPTPGYPSGRTSPAIVSPSYQTQPYGEPGFVLPRPLSSPRPDTLMYLGVPIPPPPPAAPYTESLPGFDSHRVAESIRRAFRGFGTDEKALTEALAHLDAYQVESVKIAYASATGKNLIHSIEKETSSWYEYALRGKALGPVGFDCWLLHRASSGFGTHEDILTEVLCDRTNSEILILKAAYAAIYRRDLTSIIRSELSMKTERLFNMILTANRNETEYVDFAAVQADVQVLYAAGPGRKGTDEITICSIIATRSHAHLRATVRAYHQTYRVKLSTSIHDEFSGHMKTALEYVVKGAEEDGYGVHRDTVLIHEAMHGIGTKDERLIYRVIRSHWNKSRFQAIKQSFQELYGKSLLSKVRSETSGDYRDFMCAVIT